MSRTGASWFERCRGSMALDDMDIRHGFSGCNGVFDTPHFFVLFLFTRLHLE